MTEKSLTMLADAPLTERERKRSLVAVIACISVVGMGLGVSIPLLALMMERNGVPASIIGLNTAMPALATFLMTPFIPALLRRIPAIPFLLGCILISAIAMPSYYYFPNIWLWFFIRFMNGLALTGLFVVSEFWVNMLADDRNRGRLIGIYGTVLSCGFASGPVLLFLVGTEGVAPFAVIAALILSASVPLVLFGRGLAPRVTERPSHAFVTFLVAAPAATLAIDATSPWLASPPSCPHLVFAAGGGTKREERRHFHAHITGTTGHGRRRKRASRPEASIARRHRPQRKDGF